MMKSVRYSLGLVIFIISLLTVTPVKAQGGTDFNYFNETRHNVQGAFWQYYNTLPNPEVTLGYPITEQFYNRDGVLVQYFQRARLEMVAGQVHPAPLGVFSYHQGVQLSISNTMACRSFNTGFAVCFAFLEYFDANGGLAFFGYPISPFEFQDDVIMQYFQNGRMEWRPSNPEGQRVVMSDLGTTYFYASGEDLALLDAVAPLNMTTTQTEVVSLSVRAFPWKAVTYSTDEQMIFVVVQDQTLQPVNGALGIAKVIWTDGRVQTFDVLTGDSGISTLPMPVINQNHGGLVTVEISIKHGNLDGNTATSFRIWY